MASSAGQVGWLFASLRGFNPSWLPGDAMAATTLAAIAIPEQLATARLVGMPPMSGLFAFAAGSVAFAVFGANRFMSVGADSTIAPIMAATLAGIAAAGTAHHAGMVAALALLVGVVLLLARPLRLGWIADLLSIPGTTGCSPAQSAPTSPEFRRQRPGWRFLRCGNNKPTSYTSSFA